MSDPDEPAYRLRHRATGDVSYREPEDVESDEPMFEMRMPIATTGEVRNDGDDPLTREELEGMARQISERNIPVFAGHGMDSTVADGMYSPFGRLGDWTDGEVQSRENEDVLMATARMPDPEELAAATGPYRQGLAVLKEQAKRGIAQDASIGWRDDESFAGGVDLMEASIVGIGADWRTNTGDDAAEVVARAAVDAGADPNALVDAVREATRDARPLGPPEDPDRFDSFEECKQALMDSGNSEEEAERICGAWEQNDAVDTDTTQMSDDDPGDEAGTTDEEQTAPDDRDEASERAPDDVSENQLLTFVAMHYDGMDESDLSDAVGTADGSYIGAVDVEALYDLASTVTGAEYEEVADAMESLMSESDDDGGENEGDKPDDYDDDEDDDESEQSADPDEEQSAGDESDERDLAAEVESLREELDDLRANGLSADDVDTPDPDDEQDEDTDESRDTDDDTTESPTGGLGDYR